MDPLLPALLVLLGTLLAGGNDLLDAMPTRTYWDRRGVEMTVDALAKQLDPPAGDLAADLKAIGADDEAVARRAALRVVERGPGVVPRLRETADGVDPAAAEAARQLIVAIERRPKANEVRRLMAIRGLGELKDPAALPALEAAGKSADMFVAEYAAAAVARIGNRPATRPAAAAADVAKDVWLLPANSRAVAQVRPAPAVWPTDAAVAAAVPDAARRAALNDVVATLIEGLADGLGNVRLDAVTVGLAGELAEGPAATKPGALAQVVLVARATYDAANAGRWMRTMRIPVRPIDGITAAEIGPEVLLLMPSDGVFVLMAARGRAFPTAAVAKALADGKGGLAASAGPVAAWLRAADLSQPAWGIGYFTPADRDAGLPPGVDWLSLQSRRSDGGALDVRLSATGGSVDAVRKTAGDVKAALADAAKRGDGDADVGTVLLARLATSAQVVETDKGAELRFRLTPADFFAAAAAGVKVEEK